MTLKFTPPKEDAKGLPRYASYVVGSGMKTHGRIVDAKNSWRNRGWTSVTTDKIIGQNYDSTPRYERKRVTLHGHILENVDGLWYTLYEIKPGLVEEELPWMKEYLHSNRGYYYGDFLYTDHYKNNSYYQDKISEGEFKVIKKATAMTRDEYVAWRLAIQLENLRDDKEKSL
jgi:hypothetical protein